MMDIGPTAVPKVVADIAYNHNGGIEAAKTLVGVAASFCQVDAVQFHKRSAPTRGEYVAERPSQDHAYGSTYGEHRESLELSTQDHATLKDACEASAVTYCCEVRDLDSARQIAGIGATHLKIPGESNADEDLLQWVAAQFAGTIHVSLAMTLRAEEKRLFEIMAAHGRGSDLVLYASTAAFPVPLEDLCLREITRLVETYGQHVCAVGFSGRHLGIAPDVAAVALGAQWIERRLTLDRALKGPAHAVSLEPDGMRRLARDVRGIVKALTFKPKEVLDIEQAQRRRHRAQAKPTPGNAA